MENTPLPIQVFLAILLILIAVVALGFIVVFVKFIIQNVLKTNNQQQDAGITKALLKLPYQIVYEHYTFTLELFIENHNEIRLCYLLTNCEYCHAGDSEHNFNYQLFKDTGSWNNDFSDSLCNFLWLKEGISTDAELLFAIKELNTFITVNNL